MTDFNDGHIQEYNNKKITDTDVVQVLDNENIHEEHEDVNISDDDNNGNNSIDGDHESHRSSGTDSDKESIEEDDDVMPSNYIFLSFMAYVLWDPFAIKSEKLSLFCLNDANKATVQISTTESYFEA